jgi:hypothetical protein
MYTGYRYDNYVGKPVFIGRSLTWRKTKDLNYLLDQINTNEVENRLYEEGFGSYEPRTYISETAKFKFDDIDPKEDIQIKNKI